MASDDGTKKITLRSSDGETFEVEEGVALSAQTIKYMIEDGCADNVIPLANVTSTTLAKVIEYCRRHYEDDDENIEDKDEKKKKEEEMKKWDTQFMNVDTDTLYDLILAANYLNIKELLDMGAQKVADMIKGKTPEEIRMTFNIKNDFTPEEEEKIRRENAWAFE